MKCIFLDFEVSCFSVKGSVHFLPYLVFLIPDVVLSNTQEAWHNALQPNVSHDSEESFLLCVQQNTKEFWIQFVWGKRKKNNK